MISWGDTIRAGLHAIAAHRLRSALTALGILIGIASVVLTVGLGLGAQQKVSEQISALGSNLLIVSPGSSTSDDGTRGGFGTGTTLTMRDATAVADGIAAPDVAAAVPVKSTSSVATVDSTSWTTDIIGTTAAWPQVRSRDVETGRFFTTAEVDQASAVAVIGPDTATELFESTSNVIGQTLEVSGTQLTVIGVLEQTSASGSDTSENDMILVPMATANLVTGSTTTAISTLYVQATSEDTLAAAYQEVQNLLAALHDVSSGSEDFSIATQGSLIETANETNQTMTVLLAGVAAISLLVGGIGVMNIMLVSVTERVKEIGLRKALGATPPAIRRQFLVEAGFLGLLGGALGVGIGMGGAAILPRLIDQPVTISPAAVGLALLVSVGLGIGFGVYPASRAANLLPIQALRND